MNAKLNSNRSAAFQQQNGGRMPAKPRSIRLSITTTWQIKEHLEALVATGLFGSSVSEAAEQLIREQLRILLKRKTIRQMEGE